MASSRMLLGNRNRDIKSMGTKGSTRGTRTALGDIVNVTKQTEKNVLGKPMQKSKGLETQKAFTNGLAKENKDVGVTTRKAKAMSIYENDSALAREERNVLRKPLQKSKIAGTQKSLEERIAKENKDIEAAARTVEAMSICENETKEVRPMSICEIIPPNVTDIDKESEKDPFQCAEYAANIYSYLRKIEKRLCVSDYMPKQTEINERMRSILIDWLIQVHGRFGLLQETLYLTVCLIDRFLQQNNVSRSKLQLVGVSAMLLASKYEETYAPEIGDFVYITDNSYTKGQIRKMEQLIFKTVNFDLSHPLCLQFLRRNSKAAMADAKKHTLAKYFLEMTLVDYKTSRELPSKIAAASLYLAGKLLEDADWTETLSYHSSYSEDEIIPTVKSVAKLIAKAEASKFQASRTKYSSNKFMGISAIAELKGELVYKLSQE